MDLTRKASLVVGGHQTNPPNESTYSSVVSRDSIQIAFMLAALNDLDVISADVQGAYLNAPEKKKRYMQPIQLHLIQMLSTIKHTWPYLTTRQPSMVHKQKLHGLTPTPLKWKSTEHYRAMTFNPLLHKLHPTQVPQNSFLMIHSQHIKNLDLLLLTTGYLTVVPHATINLFSATSERLKSVTYPFHLQMEPQRS
jgi:hypothetical protein